jgi:branched-subunit amino acid aminotransferase/4-amino-4-deoxychorismate lyase
MTAGRPAFPLAAERMIWRGSRSFVACPGGEHGVDVADSWLVDNGRCRGLNLHRQRFTDSCCQRHPVSRATVEAFFDDVVAVLPADGRWFPRVEYWAGQFRLWLRPAPSPATSVAIWIPDTVDPRLAPAVKGPDLAVLEDLRSRARSAGADEALLLSADGWVREGALSGLMWWRDDVLCAPPSNSGLLPSVTRRLILQLAARRGQRVRFDHVRPDDLDGLEAWSISALHGIRSVTAWYGWPLQPGPERHAAQWKADLLSLAMPTRARSRRRLQT